MRASPQLTDCVVPPTPVIIFAGLSMHWSHDTRGNIAGSVCEYATLNLTRYLVSPAATCEAFAWLAEGTSSSV